MIQQSFCQGPFLVSGLHGDQILGARDNQQDTFSILHLNGNISLPESE